MKRKINIQSATGSRKIISVVVMCACLVFLTGVNFFVYPPAQSQSRLASQQESRNNDTSPSPVEEESPSKSGVTVQEEYIHETHSSKDFLGVVFSARHKIPGDEKLQIVHYELVSPPPKA